MKIKYRPYQQQIHSETLAAFAAGVKAVLVVSPTGSGKTVMMAGIIYAMSVPTIAIAHRHELVSQMSLTLARNGISHAIDASHPTIKHICAKHMQKLGRAFYDPQSKVRVASVDTLARRDINLAGIKLWVVDEGHHLTQTNKWGKVISSMPDANGIGFTATPERSDGQGLGLHADGFYSQLIVNPKSMAELILDGSLTKFKIYSPKPSYSVDGVDISSSTGDFNQTQLRARAADSKIVGDIVGHYLKHASGKTGVTFVTDITTAAEVAAAFNANGVPAAVISAKTPSSEREAIINKLERRELMQLVNVDILGEGFDLPAIEVVSFARPTASYGLYVQQIGRGLRPSPGKTHAIIIDHVDNVRRHGGPPTVPRVWSLDRREKKASSGEPGSMKLTVCPACVFMYEGYSRICPECGHVSVPSVRGTAEQVEGELELMDLSLLDEIHREIARIDAPDFELKDKVMAATNNPLAAAGAAKRHRERQTAQSELREAIANWSGVWKSKGVDLSTRQRLFFRTFGIDVLSAQTLATQPANQLMEKIKCQMVT